MLIQILIAVGVAVVLGIISAIFFWKINTKINVVQRNLNKLENKLSAAGAEWLADVLSDAVVGDARSLFYKLSTFVESDDITEFFIDKVGMGITLYTIRECAAYYPERLAAIKKVLASVSPSSSVVNPASDSSKAS